VEEAKIISIQYHAGLFDKAGHCCLHNEHTGEKIAAVEIRKFLIDHNLGIECSGFVTQILRAHYKETKKVDIVKKFFIISPRHFLRYLISLLRPVENISVRTYADARNSQKIDWSKAQAGDVIIMLDTADHIQVNHIMLIIEKTTDVIRYAHARFWKSEGKYGHGVAQGEIKITSPNSGLLDQEWIELGRKGDENETCQEAKSAKYLAVHRLKF